MDPRLEVLWRLAGVGSTETERTVVRTLGCHFS